MLAYKSLRSVVCAQRVIRYSHGTHGHSGKPEEIEHEKQKSLKGESESSVDHAPGWNDKPTSQLASDSETKVKATKDKRSPEELQRATADSHQKEHPHGK
ncbi:MAG: hypothetical protein CYPHOPRED_000330 [Cyphobasidiales sp. Tagirdzhanova-0007]|nr:MAG: hypothetical protein CYPHOPRED_000330 [Cyphobasidiales sp. Tagirdzhanova-0007]